MESYGGKGTNVERRLRSKRKEMGKPTKWRRKYIKIVGQIDCKVKEDIGGS